MPQHNVSATGLGDISGTELRTFYSGMLLQSAKLRLMHGNWGTKISVPLHTGPTVE